MDAVDGALRGNGVRMNGLWFLQQTCLQIFSIGFKNTFLTQCTINLDFSSDLKPSSHHTEGQQDDNVVC